MTHCDGVVPLLALPLLAPLPPPRGEYEAYEHEADPEPEHRIRGFPEHADVIEYDYREPGRYRGEDDVSVPARARFGFWTGRRLIAPPLGFRFGQFTPRLSKLFQGLAILYLSWCSQNG